MLISPSTYLLLYAADGPVTTPPTSDTQTAEILARIDCARAERRLRSAQRLAQLVIAMNTWPAPLADPPRPPPRRRRWFWQR